MNQSVFVAALFLTLISVPKLIFYAVLFIYKEAVYFKMSKVVGGKAIQSLTKEETAPIITKNASDPLMKLQMTTQTLGDFQKNVRDPLIEAFTATAILFFLRPILPDIGTWLIVSVTVMIAILIEVTISSIVLWREANRILRTVPSDNPKPIST